MKVIHIISDCNAGGAQTHLLNVLREGGLYGFEIIVVCPSSGYYFDEYKKLSRKIYEVDFKRIPLAVLWEIRQILHKEQPHIVHNHMLAGCILGSYAALGIRQLKVVNNLHGHFDPASKLEWVKVFFYKKVVSTSILWNCYFIAVSNDNLRQLEKMGIPRSVIFLIYNGVDTVHFQREMDIPSRQEDILKIVAVSRLHPAKGLDTLLDAAKGLSIQVEIAIVGDGPLEKHLKNRIEAERIDNVKMFGYIKDVRPFLQSADVFIQPSYIESMGIAVAEGMAMGLPVIATNVGGIPELVEEGQGGFLFQPGKAEALKHKILLLYYCSHDQLVQMGRANRAKIEQEFSVGQMMKNIAALYDRILA